MTAPSRKAGAERRREILRAVLDLAWSNGPDKVSTGKIAARLGVTQPAIYKHFPHKEDIWRMASEYLAEEIRANIVRLEGSADDPVAGLKGLVRAHLDLVARHPALPELMTMRTEGSGPQVTFQKPIVQAMAEYRQALQSLVHAAARAGRFRRDLDAEDASLLILGLIQSLVLRMLVARDPRILHRDGPRLLDLLLSGFAPDRRTP